MSADAIETARAHLAAGRAEEALAALLDEPAKGSDYASCCVLVVRAAEQLQRLDLGVENLLGEFVRRGPFDADTAEAFDRLANLYQSQGFIENAREALAKLVRFAPEYPGAAERLEALPPMLVGELLDLPELPETPLAPQPPPKDGTGAAPFDQEADDEGPPLREGTTVGGRYRLERRVGSGATSVVFRARDEDLDDTIAVKVLTRAIYDPETDARLQRELMLSRQLVHPNVVRVFEMGRSHGFRYMTMELLEGKTLAERMRSGRLSLDEGLSYLSQACAGLQAAHDLGVVHRDVKPANCFVAKGGVLKVMDFGIAKVRDAPGLTDTGFIAGTPAYMAPEQATDFRSVTPATDQYAVGIMAYQMFAGNVPFAGEDPFQVLLAHKSDPPRPPREVVPELPAELEEIILRCLEKDPERRFGSCRELGGRLNALRTGAA